MKVGAIETGNLRQPIEIDDRQGPGLGNDQTVFAKPLKRAVDLNGRHSRGVGQLRLREGERECLGLVHQVDDAEPDAKLAEQVRKPLQGIALAHVEQPFAERRFINQRCPHQRALDAREAIHEVEHLRGRNLTTKASESRPIL